jgi:hypothetical protein
MWFAVNASTGRTDSAIFDNSPLQSGKPANIETPAPANKIGSLDASKNVFSASATGFEGSVI